MDTSDCTTIETRRAPLSITLRVDLLAFVARCAESKEIGSVDEIFDMAVEVLRMHMEALLRHVEAQGAEGLSDDDAVDAAKCEIVFRRQDR
jgi:hypothetical protein